MSPNLRHSVRVLACCLVAFGLVEFAAAATIRGSAASDTLRGTPKADRLSGGGGHDLILARAGKDRLDGGAGNDRLYGEKGNDRLVGGPGMDRVFGGAGNDVLVVRDGKRDIAACGAGKDTAIADALDSLTGCEVSSRPTPDVALTVFKTGDGAVRSNPRHRLWSTLHRGIRERHARAARRGSGERLEVPRMDRRLLRHRGVRGLP